MSDQTTNDSPDKHQEAIAVQLAKIHGTLKAILIELAESRGEKKAKRTTTVREAEANADEKRKEELKELNEMLGRNDS
jgi:uncharacterized membrane protein YkoI